MTIVWISFVVLIATHYLSPVLIGGTADSSSATRQLTLFPIPLVQRRSGCNWQRAR